LELQELQDPPDLQDPLDLQENLVPPEGLDLPDQLGLQLSQLKSLHHLVLLVYLEETV